MNDAIDFEIAETIVNNSSSGGRTIFVTEDGIDVLHAKAKEIETAFLNGSVCLDVMSFNLGGATHEYQEIYEMAYTENDGIHTDYAFRTRSYTYAADTEDDYPRIPGVT